MGKKRFFGKGKVLSLIAGAMLLFTQAPVFADQVSDLKKEIDDLSTRIMIVEAESSDGSSAQTIDLQGYYDFTYVDESNAGVNGTFRQHHLSIFVGATRNKFKMFSEIEFEFGPKLDLEGTSTTSTQTTDSAGDHTHTIGENGGTNKVEILVETAWLEYVYKNWLAIRTGKHLTPYGWWNGNHYPILALTTSRPDASKRIFPTGSTGIQLYGSAFFGGLKTAYNLYYVNDIDNDATNKWDADNNKGVGGRLAFSLPILNKFDIGFSALGGRSNNTTDNQYWGFDEIIQVGPFELLSEFAYNDQRNLSSGVRLYQKGYYVQPSVTVPAASYGDVSFVYRYEYLNLSSIGFNSRDKTVHTFGLAFKPRPDVALKAEHNLVRPDSTSTGKHKYTDTQLSVTIYF